MANGDTLIIGEVDLGEDFDVGTIQPKKINVVSASTTVPGKARFATDDEIAHQATGVMIDAYTFGTVIPGAANAKILDAFQNAVGYFYSFSGSATSTEFVALANLDNTVFDIGNLLTNKVSISTFTGATNVTAGTRGLVPAPGVGQAQNYSLRGDGSWQPTLALSDAGSLSLTYQNRSGIPMQGDSLLQVIGGNGQDVSMEIVAFGGAARFYGIREDGTTDTTISTLQTNDEIVSFDAMGFNGSAITGPAARLSFFAAEAWTNTANGTYFVLSVTPDGTKNIVPALRIDNDGGLSIPPSVPGGSQGAGSINAEEIYQNGQPVATQAFTLAMIIALS